MSDPTAGGAGRARRVFRSIQRHHLVLAGIIDAAVSSGATFIVGLAATYYLQPEVLGAYALAFSIFVVSGFIPAQLVFTPTEIAAVEYPVGQQLPLLRVSLPRGAAVSFLAAVTTSAWVLIAPSNLPGDALAPLAITCAIAAFLSPIQDHLRRMLHVAEASWRSVVVAIVQLGVAIGAVGIMSVARIPAPWIPFGVLILANLVSGSVALLLSFSDLRVPASPEGISRARLIRSGRPLLVVGLVPSITAFAVSWLVSSLAGAATLGFVEAARIVSQPVSVLQTGLASVLGPRVTRAARAGDPAAARRIKRQFERLILLAGVGWLLAVGLPAPWNPLPTILATAYAVPGLVAVSIVAFTIMSLPQSHRFELFGIGEERLVARAEVEGNAIRLAIAAGVGVLGAFAAPLGVAALGLTRWVRSARWLAEHWRTAQASQDNDPGDVR
jgi:O-antigen/teichoic acid export membrane protein